MAESVGYEAQNTRKGALTRRLSTRSSFSRAAHVRRSPLPLGMRSLLLVGIDLPRRETAEVRLSGGGTAQQAKPL
jgi:hypothetical protein